MALSNLFGWNKKMEAAPAAACGAVDKPEGAQGPVDLGPARTEAERRQPAACGAGDKPAETPAACGAGDKQ